MLVEAVALFIHLFTTNNAKPWITGGLVIFFIVFIPLYSIEYFRQEFKKGDRKKISFRKKNTRTEWHGEIYMEQYPAKKKGPVNYLIPDYSGGNPLFRKFPGLLLIKKLRETGIFNYL